MTMQDNIDIVRRNVGRNMHEAKSQSAALKIDNQRPVVVPIAVPADNRQGRTDRFEIIRDRRLANVTQMPNLVRFARKIDNRLRQFVVSVSDNEHAHCFQQSAP